MPIGMSRSVRGRVSSPARMRVCAARALMRPVQIGPASLPKVQTAAVAMVPAPMKRTWVFQIVVAASAAGPAAWCSTVSSGVATPQEMISPARMATPTVIPIR